MWKTVLLWIPMVGIAVLNGSVREMWYGPLLGDLRAHQVSTLVGLGLFAVYTWAVMRVWPPLTTRQAIGVGLTWLTLTVAFEFGFGRFVAGHSWSRLLHDYNLLAGRLWVCILLWIAIAPLVWSRRHRRGSTG
ncbi:MAG: hypothetical protein MUE60_16830 [Candidatus Eisenbacteria bacterium]|jgi:hypothetical protein|nr:hypothetical protein [Candidatus Eisenbacteria bacterium]